MNATASETLADRYPISFEEFRDAWGSEEKRKGLAGLLQRAIMRLLNPLVALLAEVRAGALEAAAERAHHAPRARRACRATRKSSLPRPGFAPLTRIAAWIAASIPGPGPKTAIRMRHMRTKDVRPAWAQPAHARRRRDSRSPLFVALCGTQRMRAPPEVPSTLERVCEAGASRGGHPSSFCFASSPSPVRLRKGSGSRPGSPMVFISKIRFTAGGGRVPISLR